jgi:orotidine-5'-phosphate decarboxylase
MTAGKKQLIVALDVPSVAEARELIAALGDNIGKARKLWTGAEVASAKDGNRRTIPSTK